MLGIDTNVLLRALVKDDSHQSPAAQRFLDRQLTQSDPGFINLIVLVETAWALRQTYGYGKADIVNVMNGLLDTAELLVEDAPAVKNAVKLFEDHPIDFADALIAVRNSDRSCETTMTFDKKFAGSGLAKLL